MKRFVACLITCFVLALSMKAENILSISSSSGHPGDEVTVNVSLTNTDKISAVQLDIPLDENLSFVERSLTMNQSRSNGHGVSSTLTSNGVRLLIYNLSLKELVGNDGELISFRLKIGSEPADYAISPQCILTDADGKRLSCKIESGNVRILSPKMELVQTEIDFGHQPIRASYVQNLEIKNVGNEQLSVSSSSFQGGRFSIPRSQFSIESGKSMILPITYSPTQKGVVKDTLRLESNAVNGIQNIVVNASSYTVNEIHIQPVEGLSDDTVEVEVKMNNMEAIAAVQLSFNLPEELQFVANSAVSMYSSHTAYASEKNGVLKLMMYSPANKTIPEIDGPIMKFKIRLLGESGSYALNPTEVVLGNLQLENVVSSFNGSDILIMAPAIKCDEVADLGSCDVTKVHTLDYTITNIGQKELTITRVTFADDRFSLLTELPLSVMENESKTIKIQYSPQNAGADTSAMKIYTNDPTQRMKIVSLVANAYSPNTIQVDGAVDLSQMTARVSVSLENHSQIVGAQMDLKVKEGLTLNTNTIIKSSRLSSHSIYCSKIDDQTYRLTIYSVTNSAIKESAGEIFTIDLSASEKAVMEGELLKITQIKLSDKSGADKVSESSTSFIYHKTDLTGDVNKDDVVNIEDVLAIVRGYLNMTEEKIYDINSDGIVDVSDAVHVLNLILTKN